MTPQRIQLRRSAGWRMPEGTLKVDRSTKWGNPFAKDIHGPVEDCLRDFEALAKTWDLSPLAGKHLACWCPPGEPCHADILLRLANERAGVQGPGFRGTAGEEDPYTAFLKAKVKMAMPDLFATEPESGVAA